MKRRRFFGLVGGAVGGLGLAGAARADFAPIPRRGAEGVADLCGCAADLKARLQDRPVDEAFVQALRALGVSVATGSFGARMAVFSEADGPVNIILDTPEL